MDEGKIVLIDDDVEVLGSLSRALKREGFDVKAATSGEEGLKLLKQEIPDLLILDIIMPTGMNGLEVCKVLRGDDSYNTLPILFLSARGQTDEVVEGLDAGGDDYLVKPFELTELRARIRALMRRAQREVGSSAVVRVGDFKLDSNTHQVDFDAGRSVQLTATEHRLLRYMIDNLNQALSTSRLLQDVWSYPSDAGDADLVRAHIRNLRAKIEHDRNEPRYIRTIHGVGYMVTDEEL